MKLHELSPAAGSSKSAWRKGRGPGSGNGKTGGRGHKGQNARTGGGVKFRLIKKMTGFDVVKAVVDLTLGKKTHAEVKKTDKKIINEFLYCIPGVLDHLEGFEELKIPIFNSSESIALCDN